MHLGMWESAFLFTQAFISVTLVIPYIYEQIQIYKRSTLTTKIGQISKLTNLDLNMPKRRNSKWGFK